MKKRIFISMHYMEIGGAETALIGMLQSIDYSQFDVDLFLHAHRGEMMQFIPKEVNLLPEIKEYSMIEKPLVLVLMAGYFRVAYARLKAKCQFWLYRSRKHIPISFAMFQYIGNEVTPILPSLESFGDYDLAISYHAPHNIVHDKVKAKKKICWIHNDYTRLDVNTELELPVWASYDHVMSISSDVTKTFLQVFPSLKDNIVEMENILPSIFVRHRAQEYDALPELNKYVQGRGENQINILSIGRFTHQKNYDNIPDICRRINSSLFTLHSSFSVYWFLIGYGDEKTIRRKIKEASMDKHVIILGKRTNPYPYIKACDIYIQPSRYEGKSVTVREAQMLCKPVVVTNYPTSSSQIQDGIDGRIVPIANEECAKGIVDFILDKELHQHIVDYLQTHNYGNEAEIEKLYKLMT